MIHRYGLALSTGGQEVAWRADRHDSGILFYGEAPDSLYDSERYYMLSQGRGLEIRQVPGRAPWPAPERGTFYDKILAEENLLLRPFNVMTEGEDFWFWAAVLAEDPDFGEQVLEVEIEDVADVNASARVQLGFVGFAPGDIVSASVFVNDNYVGDLYGPILMHSDSIFGFPQTALVNGSNTVRVVGRRGGVLINRVQLEYHRELHASADQLTVRNPDQRTVSIDGFSTLLVEAYDISDPMQPVLLPSDTKYVAAGSSVELSFNPTDEGSRYLAVASTAIRQPATLVARGEPDWRASLKGADYVIITTTDLVSSAERLAGYREQDGLETLVVDVEDIFDHFGFGSRDPVAINEFLAEATNSWSLPPRYVVLAGRGHYDYQDNMGFGGNLVPPMLAASREGLVPSDYRLADLDSDGRPDLAIGRLPVLTADELDVAINKIIAYESEESGDWSKKVMLAVDDPDDAGEFTKSGDAVALAVPEGFDVEKVYLFNPYLASEVNAFVTGALEEGIGIVNWIGHASFGSLADEQVLTVQDLSELETTGHPSMVLGLTCLMSNFGLPYYSSLGEELALLPGAGAIGVWASGGLSNNARAEKLGESFMAVLDDSSQQRLGDIIQVAIDEFIDAGWNAQSVNQYNLMGDPGLVMK
jgi:hypothetical protein